MVDTVQEKLLIEAKADLERALDTYWRLVVLQARGTAHFPKCLCGSCGNEALASLVKEVGAPADPRVRR